MELSTYEIDSDASENGRWFKLGDGRIKLRSLSSTKSKAVAREIDKSSYASYRAMKVVPPDELVESNFGKHLVEANIVDFENMSLRGEPLPYSKENAHKLISFPIVREFVSKVLQDELSFTVGFEDAAIKN